MRRCESHKIPTGINLDPNVPYWEHDEPEPSAHSSTAGENSDYEPNAKPKKKMQGIANVKYNQDLQVKIKTILKLKSELKNNK